MKFLTQLAELDARMERISKELGSKYLSSTQMQALRNDREAIRTKRKELVRRINRNSHRRGTPQFAG